MSHSFLADEKLWSWFLVLLLETQYYHKLNVLVLPGVTLPAVTQMAFFICLCERILFKYNHQYSARWPWSLVVVFVFNWYLCKIKNTIVDVTGKVTEIDHFIPAEYKATFSSSKRKRFSAKLRRAPWNHSGMFSIGWELSNTFKTSFRYSKM